RFEDWTVALQPENRPWPREEQARPKVGILLSRRSPSLLSSASRRFGLFDEGFLADDDDDAGIADVKAAAVGFKVIADFGALGKAHVAVADGAAAGRVAADVRGVVDNGI